MKSINRVEPLAREFSYPLSDVSAAVRILRDHHIPSEHVPSVLRALFRAAHASQVNLKATELATFAVEFDRAIEVT
jgi:hypothetical protein